jgi:hypothetical protein
VTRVGEQGIVIEFIHPPLDQEVRGRAGYYIPVEEHTLSCNGREVLYILGYACLDNSCCSVPTSWGYIQVPGFLVRRHIRGEESGSQVSEVEIVEDEADRNSIRRLLLEKYPGIPIEMWGAQYAQRAIPHSASGSEGSSI